MEKIFIKKILDEKFFIFEREFQIFFMIPLTSKNWMSIAKFSG